jgi:hypothetical protein
MSSWKSGKVHFRERKMPTRAIVPEVSQPIQELAPIVPIRTEYSS